MAEKKRDYAKEYREYHGKPEQIKARSQRNAARAKLGLKVGDPREADHRNPISNGGSGGFLSLTNTGTLRKSGATGTSGLYSVRIHKHIVIRSDVDPTHQHRVKPRHSRVIAGRAYRRPVRGHEGRPVVGGKQQRTTGLRAILR